MNRFFQAGVSCLLVLGSSGCEYFATKLTVTQDFIIQNHHILKRTAEFAPGTYDVNLVYHTVENLLEFKTKGHSSVEFKIPHEYVNNDGSVHLKGADIGENWNADGNFVSTVTNSASGPGTVSCVLYYETVISGYDGNGNPIYSSQPVYGTQNVIFHVQTNTRTISLGFSSLTDQSSLATLVGDDSSSQSVIDKYTSRCY